MTHAARSIYLFDDSAFDPLSGFFGPLFRCRGSRRGQASVVQAFMSRPWLLRELLRSFSSSWLLALPQLVSSCARDVASGQQAAAGLLQATHERFQAMLRGHSFLYVLGLVRNFGTASSYCQCHVERS